MKDKIEQLKKYTGIKVESTAGKIALYAFLSVVLSFFVGLVIFGWYLTPVEWEPPEALPGMNGLTYQSKATYVYALSEWYAYSGNDEKLNIFLSQLADADVVACSMAQNSTDTAEYARLITIAYKVNGYGCNSTQE